MLILAAFGLMLAMIASALSIDLGRLAQDKRNDQKVADIAALDAVRALGGDFQLAALQSATATTSTTPLPVSAAKICPWE